MKKIVINDCFGGFALTDDMIKALGVNSNYDTSISRDDPRLIKLVEDYIPEQPAYGCCTHYKITEIPDEATDWRIIEYDGLEYVIYVKEGKMHEAY